MWTLYGFWLDLLAVLFSYISLTVLFADINLITPSPCGLFWGCFANDLRYNPQTLLWTVHLNRCQRKGSVHTVKRNWSVLSGKTKNKNMLFFHPSLTVGLWLTRQTGQVIHSSEGRLSPDPHVWHMGKVHLGFLSDGHFWALSDMKSLLSESMF